MISDTASRLRAAVAPTIWQRRWVVVWNAGASPQSDSEWLAHHLPRLGYSVVCVKVCDGASVFHGSHGLNVSVDWLKPLYRAGIRVTGWGYTYAASAGADAVRALELAGELGLHAYVADAEREYEADSVVEGQGGVRRPGFNASKEWLHVWRSARRRPPLGLTSFGRVDLHRLDWAAWRQAGARFLPQAYANESAELEVGKCVRAASAYWDRRFVHPWLGCYPVKGSTVPGAEYARQLRAARTRGFAVYLAETAAPEDLRALGRAR